MGIPRGKVQVTVVPSLEDTPVPVTPKRLQSILSVCYRSVPVKMIVLSSPLVLIAVTVGEVALIA
jgi:hypothetical protein